MRIDLLAPSAIVRIKACDADLAAACIVSTHNNIDGKDLGGRTLESLIAMPRLDVAEGRT